MESSSNTKMPSWLNKIYLQDVLRRKYSKDLEVLSFTAEPPVAAGNNYVSLILRAKAECLEEGTRKEHSIIVKTVPVSDENAKTTVELGAYTNETQIYSNYLPRIQGLLESMGDSDKIAPLAIYVDETHQAMVFEDMKSSNYVMADRRIGLDWNHIKIVMKKIAKFHACSAVMAEQGDKYENFQKSLFEVFDTYFIVMFTEFSEEVRHWPGYEIYGEKLVKLSKTIIPETIAAYKTKPEQFRVLCHGDLWTCNILFKYDDQGVVEDACLIDYQIPVQTSPVCDLISFLYSSASDEVRFDHKKPSEMLQLYHKYLTETLTQLKSKTKPPTLFELYQEFQARLIISVIFIITLPAILNENDESSDLQNIVGDSDTAKAFRNQMLANPRAIKTFKHFLPLFDIQRLLDPLK